MLHRFSYLFISIFCITLLASQDGCVKRGSIESFTIQPTTICAGDTINISWTAFGRVSLSASPAANVRFSSTGTQPAEGSMTATVRDTANITITAEGTEGSDSENKHLTVMRSGDIHRISSFGQCDGATPAWSNTFEPSEFSDNIRVDVVTNITPDSAVNVSHAGRADRIAPFGRSSTFSGTLLEGDWIFSRDVTPNPCLEERSGPVPGVTVEATITCGP